MDDELEKWKESSLLGEFVVGLNWQAYVMWNLNLLRNSLPIDMGRSDFSEIKKSYQTYKRKFSFLRSVHFSFQRIFMYFKKENVEVVRICICNIKITNCVQKNYTFSPSEFSKLNMVSNYKFNRCIWFPRDVYIYIPRKLTIHPFNL